jgi:hypothetical protein
MDADLSAEAMAKAKAFAMGTPLGNKATRYRAPSHECSRTVK